MAKPFHHFDKFFQAVVFPAASLANVEGNASQL